jgi:hypothetical protein
MAREQRLGAAPTNDFRWGVVGRILTSNHLRSS